MKKTGINELKIPVIDQSLHAAIEAHLNDLTKPPGSLGRLETMACRYCLAKNTTRPSLQRKRIVVFAGDHGIAAAGVSAFPSEVTPQMVRNMLADGAAINVLARHAGADIRVVDVGVADPLDDAPGLIRRKVRAGTADFSRQPAMTADEAAAAMAVGIEQADDAAAAGMDIVVPGEMGIGNTSPATALMAALLPCEVRQVVGRGTGIDDARLQFKATIIEAALQRHAVACSTPCGAMAAVGGLEITAMTGFMLGAACHRIPIVVDGFIASAAALTALRLHPEICHYLFYSHCSAEAGHRQFFSLLDESPLFNLDMRLGEGTGAALALHMIEAAVKLYNEMATFSSAGVNRTP